MTTATFTRRDTVALLRERLLAALHGGVLEVVCSDVDFADWPLNEPAVVEALTQWAGPQRRLVLLAQHYDEVRRRHPRFVRWRTTWAHLVDARSPTECLASDHPGLLWTADEVVEVLDRITWRACRSADPATVGRCRHAIDAVLQRSEHAFAPTTLGL